MKCIIERLLILSVFLVLSLHAAIAQETIVQDYSQLMDIPDITAMEASPTHLYILSKEDGMAVFRTYQDSLQWLYTSNGMQRRGNNIMADIRFAYLSGDSKRLTVLEPTSALGVYSSTILPLQPKSAARLRNNLYFAMGNMGLGKVSLNSPESVDSDPIQVASNELNSASVINLRSTELNNQLLVLTDTPSLMIFSQEEESLNLDRTIMLDTQLSDLFIDEEEIWGSTNTGEIFTINADGIGSRIGVTGEKNEKVLKWKDHIFVRTQSGQVWVKKNNGTLDLWKNDSSAGNYIAKSGESLWIAENDKVSLVTTRPDSSFAQNSPNNGDSFNVKPIDNQVITYPNPLILALEMEGMNSSEDIKFSFRSNIDNAKIRKQGFYWQPTINQTGRSQFTIIARNSKGASDSTRFVVDVRSFNAPPRFSPVRTTSIAVNEKYTVTFNASDPENPQNSLIRYIGVDLPEGASINEKTGQFTWTPSERQIGESTFRVIATDKLGAASSIDVTINVLNISRDGEQ